jgi:hypothetical protein
LICSGPDDERNPSAYQQKRSSLTGRAALDRPYETNRFAKPCSDNSNGGIAGLMEAERQRRIAAEIDKDKDALAQATCDESGLPLVKSAGYLLAGCASTLGVCRESGCRARDEEDVELERSGLRCLAIRRPREVPYKADY